MSYSPFDVYRRPFLDVEAVTALPDGSGLRLEAHGRSLDLAVEGDGAAARALIEGMRDPGWPGWDGIRDDGTGQEAGLLGALDLQGWIADADPGHAAAARADRDLLLHTGAQAADWLAGADAAWRRHAGRTGRPADAFAASLARTTDLARALWEERAAHRLSAAPIGTTGPAGESLPGLVLAAAFRAWQRTSPLALAPFTGVGAAGVGAAGVGAAGVGAAGAPTGGLADAQAVRNQVWAACLLTLAAADAPPARFADFCPTRAEAGSGPGVNLLVAAERRAERLVHALGRSEVLEAVAGRRDAGRIAKATYLHQHFVTIRYLEAVLSFLRHRLREPLRGTGFRYFLEEFGHEEHEREACLHLGLTDADIARFAPLPLFEVYSDILGYVAEIDPLGFCLSIMVAEGLPGAGKPVTEALDRQGFTDPSLTAHGEIDVTLDHATYTRRLLRHVSLAEGADAVAAMHHLLFAVELSQRAWASLAAWGAAADLPEVPEAFALDPERALAIAWT